MRRFVWCMLCMGMVACASAPGMKRVDGGLVTPDGWPARASDPSADLAPVYRCPPKTDLRDQRFREGRRRVSCVVQGTNNLAGFQLSWNASGGIETVLHLDDGGLPKEKTTWHANGNKRSEEVYDGPLTLRSSSWYDDGAPLSLREVLPNDGGIRVERWQIDGTIEASGLIVDNQKSGVWKEWRDGALETRTYEDGLVIGVVRRQYPDGSMETGQYQEGQRHGLWSRRDRDERPVREVEYVAGVQQGIAKAWHPNGQSRSLSHFLNGRLHDVQQIWYPSGQAKIRGRYRCGLKDGQWQSWHPNGVRLQHGYYADGERVGLWVKWNDRGSVISEEYLDIPVDEMGRPAMTLRTPDGILQPLETACRAESDVGEDTVDTIRREAFERTP